MKPGDLKKFEKIVNQHQGSLIGFHYRFVGNRFEAEDLAQETFIKAYLGYKTLKDRKKLKSWLFSIARNVVIDFFRKNKNREIALDSETVLSLADEAGLDLRSQISNHETFNEIKKCVDKLEPEDRLLVKLLYYEGFSYNEIEKLLAMNRNTLKSKLHRARKVLLEIIKTNDVLSDLAIQYS